MNVSLPHQLDTHTQVINKELYVAEYSPANAEEYQQQNGGNNDSSVVSCKDN